MVCNISNTLRFYGPHLSSRLSVTLHVKISSRTPCKPFRLCAVSRLWVRFFRATPPYYPACIAVMNSPNNAKVVPSGSAELGERIHINTIARNAREPPEKPQFPRIYWPKKTALGLDRAMTSSTIVASSLQPLNTVMQTVNWLTGHTFSPILASIWPILTRDGSFWWEDEGQVSNDIALMIKSRRPYANEERKYASLASSRFYA